MDWKKWQNRLFYFYLRWQGSPAKIRAFIRRQNKKTKINQERIDHGQKSRIKVAALQLEMNLYKNPLDFVTKMNLIVREAVEKGARLVVFPEDNLTQLIGLLPGIGNEKESGQKIEVTQVLKKLGENVEIKDILNYIGPMVKQISLTTFSELAKSYGIYIMSGTGMLPDEDNKIYNLGYLFDPEGNLLGEQRKAHLLPLEDEWGLEVGDEFKVMQTEIGRLAFPICMDATYFETFRIVKEKGAEIVMLPIANPDPNFNYWTALRGIWGRVQESSVYGIKSAMVGDFLGFKFTGQAGIYAPLELTPDRSGILAEAKSFNQEEMVLAELDLTALKELKNDYDLNQEFWDRYFPEVYYFI